MELCDKWTATMPAIRETVVVVLVLAYCGIVQAFNSNIATVPLASRATPEFNGPIENVTVPVGREAILTCSVNNLGQYKVAWIRADQTILSVHSRVITHNPRIGVTYEDNPPTWKLHIRQLKESDQACYMCQINTDSMKSQYGCIQVQVPPDIDDAETSGDITVTEGENATLICKAKGHPEPRILWRREDGEYIILQPKPHRIERVDSFSGSRLTLTRVERRQMGAYLCIASNDVPPAVSKRITFNVNFAPQITVPNQLLGAPLNTDVEMECHVEAFPNTINYWVKAKSDIIMDGEKYSIKETKTGYKTHMVLTIRNIQKKDMSTYFCISTNSLGKAEGPIRLYEIKVVQTKPPLLTTEIKTTEPETTTIATTYRTESTTKRTTTLNPFEALLEDPLQNAIPSAEPAPLETMLSAMSSSRACKSSWFKLVTVIVLAFR